MYKATLAKRWWKMTANRKHKIIERISTPSWMKVVIKASCFLPLRFLHCFIEVEHLSG